MTIARIAQSTIGANPFMVEGPIVAGSGIPGPNFRLGTVIPGEAEAEFVYVKLVLASQTTLSPGQAFYYDKDFSAALLTTSAVSIGQNVGVFAGALLPSTVTGGPITAVTLAAGTYYIWLQRHGNAPAFVTTATANLIVAETTATAGKINAPSSATSGSKAIAGVTFSAANFTFTATATSGSAVLTNVSGASPASGPFIGASLSQTTGITSSQTITGITYSPNGTIQSITMSAAADGTATGTVTATGVLEARLRRPYVSASNP
ncbi:MAG TPA: hypothetical protein VN112_16265 [Ensifer sp.]|nr:hypothetical protein [Ensifer sp.]